MKQQATKPTLYQRYRAAGRCVQCGSADTGGKAKCAAARISTRFPGTLRKLQHQEVPHGITSVWVRWWTQDASKVAFSGHRGARLH